MRFDRESWRALLIVVLMLAGFVLKGQLIAPPQPPERVAAGQFDTSRALARLQRILGDQRPHPVDSTADDAVRERLIAELNAIGLQSRVQEAEDCSGFPKSRVVSCSRIRNVIATIPGTGPGSICCSAPIMTAHRPVPAPVMTVSVSRLCSRSARS